MNAITTLLQQIGPRVALDDFGFSSSGRFSCVMRTPRFRASRHVIWMIIPESAAEPALVAKVPRLCDDRGGVELEAANLRAAHVNRLAATANIPRVVALEDLQGHLVLLETAMAGRALSPAVIRRDTAASIRLVTGWLGEFQSSRSCAIRERPGAIDRLIDRPLAVIEASGLLEAAEAPLLARCRALIAPLRDGGFPLVFEHGDLGHPNLLRSPQGELAVLDWELADRDGLPGADLFFFLTYVAFALSRAKTLSAQVRAFDAAWFRRKSWTGPHVIEHAARLGIPASLLAPLFVMSWTRYLAGLIGRLGGENAAPRRLDEQLLSWLRSNRYFSLWKHAVEQSGKLSFGTF